MLYAERTLSTAGNAEEKMDNNLTVTLDIHSFRLFLNPVTSVLNVNMSAFATRNGNEVYGNTGRTILTQIVSSSGTQLTVSKLPAGIYLLTVISKEGNIVNKAKFVKD